MKTNELIMQVKQAFNVSNYWLENFFDVHHSLFLRYAKGLSEARFSDVLEWLDKLNLCILNKKLYFKNNLLKPISDMPKWYLITKLNSIHDNIEWKKYGKKEEKENGHIIFWPNKKHTGGI